MPCLRKEGLDRGIAAADKISRALAEEPVHGRENVGKPSSGGGAPPAKPASETKPNSDGKPAGTSKPNSSTGKGARQCGAKITSTRMAAVTRKGGMLSAQVGWMAAAQKVHPDSWGNWDKAKDRSLSCNRVGLLFNCTASARPCEP